ncbi:MAG TPA: maleylpyruvate isomerase family mycothiol-dependent enzyme [Acidimicrobiales bacterium]|nr:maleylpyruvate isomerase family mycothiol-dependent enzyme [Acidimicrobiales bacterium]
MTAREVIRREIEGARDVLEVGRESLWRAETRLPGWSVADLAAHLAWGQALQADAWQKILLRDASPVTAAEVSGDRTQVLEALRANAEALAANLAKATETDLETIATMPYGPVPAGFLVQIAAMEAGLHGSDLRAATGRDDSLPVDVAHAAHTMISATAPLLAAGATSSPAAGTSIALAPSGEETARFVFTEPGWQPGTAAEGPPSVLISGPASEVVLFTFGRRSIADARGRGLSIEGDADVAARFKEFFPGP